MENKKESRIIGFPDIIPYEKTKVIMEQMEKYICQIKIGNKQGTGFFCKIPFPNEENLLRVFITNNHVINQDLLNENIKNISFSIEEESDDRIFNLNDRMKYTNEEYDITIIEIKKSDNINNYLELDDKIKNDIIKNDNKNDKFKDNTIYIIQYPEGELSVSFGVIKNINENKKYDFGHLCSTRDGSSGSPILNKKNRLIGIHKEGKDNLNFNKGTFLNYPIKEFIQQYNCKINKNLDEKGNKGILLKNNIENNKYEVVVGIQCDSSGSGFAYSFMNKNKIFHGIIYGAFYNFKVPTEIILDDNNNVIQFGSNCIKYLIEKGTSSGHYYKIDYIDFSLNNNLEAENTRKKLPLTLIIQKVLESIKKIAIENLSRINPYFSNATEKIKWIVAIPVTFNEQQKDLMMKSCFGAGLINNNDDKYSTLILEQEAACFYCSIHRDKLLEKGKNYIVCNLGEKSGSIVAHKFGSNEKLNDIFPVYGVNYGSAQIEKHFFQDIIEKIFACKDFNSFYLKYKKYNSYSEIEKEELYKEWSELEREIKDFYESTTIEKIKSNEMRRINFSLFQEIFDEDISISDLIKDYNKNEIDNCLKLSIVKTKKKWIIDFPYKIVYDYMKIQANTICNIINNICSKTEVKALIFIGHYSSNEVIIHLINKGLNFQKTCLYPSNPDLGLMEGTVLFGVENLSLNKK